MVMSMNITPDALEKFIVDSSKSFDFIPLEKILDRIKKTQKRKFMVFTFDDGFQSVYDNALPIFNKYNVPFTVFVSTGILGEKKTSECIMTEQQIKTLSNFPVVSLGGHTISHANLSTLSFEDTKHEIVGNITSLERLLGLKLKTFAYPFGLYNDAALNILYDNNIYMSVLASGGCVTSAHDNNYLLPRVNLDESTNAKELKHWRNVYMGL